jgi:hypothetical protein
VVDVFFRAQRLWMWAAEAEDEADGANVKNECVDEEQAQHVAVRPGPSGEGQVQKHHDDVDHAFSLSAAAATRPYERTA